MLPRKMRDKAMRENKIVSAPLEYEPPVLTVVGDLHDVVAGTTQALICDSNTHIAGGSDGNVNLPSC
jgi:hypothetical protein